MSSSDSISPYSHSHSVNAVDIGNSEVEAECSGAPLNPVDQDDDAAEPPEGDEGTSIAPEVDNTADEEEEAQQPLGFVDPGMPTAAQIAEHNLTPSRAKDPQKLG